MGESDPILGLIGAGNMAGAMVEGWVRADRRIGERLLVTDRGSGRAARLAERHGVQPRRRATPSSSRRADVVVLCVKPIDVERVLREVSELITPGKAIASVAAGVRTATLETILDAGRAGLPVHAERRRAGRRGHALLRRGRFTDTAAEARVLGWLPGSSAGRPAGGAAVRRRHGARPAPAPRSSAS